MDDSNAPVTKADLTAGLAGLETRLHERQDILRSEINERHEILRSEINERHEILRSEMQHVHDALVERIADSETKLLQAFYTFAQSNQQRLAQVESNTNAVVARLATLEIRLLEVERRLNMPPAA